MLASHQSSLTSVRRDAWVEVDLGALEANIATVRSWLSPQTELMAVAKSDGYGHGAPGIAPVLVASGASQLGVASVDEGMQLREARIQVPILILGPCPFWAVGTAIQVGLDLTVTEAGQIADIASAAKKLGKKARVHLKIDTGMHRLGAPPNEVANLVALLDSQPAIECQGVFSHLARADEEAPTASQNETFRSALAPVTAMKKPPDLIHLASGQAARLFPETHYDMVRVGLYIYGLEPRAISQVVTPCLSVRARINHLTQVEAGESVGYGHTFTAERATRLASIPIGYADGVDRRLSNRMTALLMGKEIRQVGTISMDQMLFDVTDVPQSQIGDIVTLIGSDSECSPAAGSSCQLYLATWATMLDTITYELACRLRVRLPRIYTRKPAAQAGG